MSQRLTQNQWYINIWKRKEERDMEVLEEILIHKIWIRHIKTVANKDVVEIDDIAVEEI